MPTIRPQPVLFESAATQNRSREKGEPLTGSSSSFILGHADPGAADTRLRDFILQALVMSGSQTSLAAAGGNALLPPRSVNTGAENPVKRAWAIAIGWMTAVLGGFFVVAGEQLAILGGSPYTLSPAS